MSAMLYPDNEFCGLDSLSTGTLVLDEAGAIRYVNAATETLLGVSGALLIGDDAAQAFARSPELLLAIRTARTESRKPSSSTSSMSSSTAIRRSVPVATSHRSNGRRTAF